MHMMTMNQGRPPESSAEMASVTRAKRGWPDNQKMSDASHRSNDPTKGKPETNLYGTDG